MSSYSFAVGIPKIYVSQLHLPVSLPLPCVITSGTHLIQKKLLSSYFRHRSYFKKYSYAKGDDLNKKVDTPPNHRL